MFAQNPHQTRYYSSSPGSAPSGGGGGIDEDLNITGDSDEVERELDEQIKSMEKTDADMGTIELAEKIAGEIVLSDNPGEAIRKWRKTFSVTPKELAQTIQVSPSMISDYESGRRKSPGSEVIKRVVNAFIFIDQKKGGETLKRYNVIERARAILDMKEFSSRVSAKSLVHAIEGRVLTNKDKVERDIHGYTVLDSLRAIIDFNSSDYLKVYGWSTERALIFTGVKFGRSPMIAIRAHPMKPAMVVFHKPENIDALAIKLSETEKIPLVTTDMELDELMKSLRSLSK